jgi:hypothetical protein
VQLGTQPHMTHAIAKPLLAAPNPHPSPALGSGLQPSPNPRSCCLRPQLQGPLGVGGSKEDERQFGEWFQLWQLWCRSQGRRAWGGTRVRTGGTLTVLA